MTRLFKDDGSAVPVTAIATGDCYVTDVKTKDRDGYTAVQVGFDSAKKTTKALQGHLKDLGNLKHIKEFRVDDVDGIERGKKINLSTFAIGDSVKVVGKSKGRGFQGVVKRHGFKGSPASHGHKDQLRMPGSIGATDAARVFKGKRMGGHMGDAQTTVANLEVVEIDLENNILFLKGAVPGARGSLLYLKADGDLVFAEEETKTEEVQETPAEENKEEVKTEKTEDAETKEDKKEETKTEEKSEEAAKDEKVEDKKEEIKEDKPEEKKEEKTEEDKNSDK